MTIDADWFDARINTACAALHGDELLLGSLHAESTDFARFNHAQIRQAGAISQANLDLDLIAGRRHATATLQLTGDATIDDARIGMVVSHLRDQRAELPDDPHLVVNTEPTSTHRSDVSTLPDTNDVVTEIATATADHDMVGVYAAGPVASGFANSLGQRNWFETSTFDFDWTLYLEGARAVKTAYAGFEWKTDAFERKVRDATAKLEALQRPARDLAPGDYRTLLTPAAIGEIMELLAWNAFGVRAQRTSQSPLLRLVTGLDRLDERVRLAEHTASGISPNFQEQGWLRPDEVVLVDEGRAVDPLISPRSSVEYDLEPNGASSAESPAALSMQGGDLDEDDALAALGTGLWVGNLWYTNYSDVPGCRVTGMTRFATFWVEGGEVVAPVNVLRFDDSLYQILGDRLVDLTAVPELIVDNSTYEQRTNASMRLPGALVDGMRFTL